MTARTPKSSDLAPPVETSAIPRGDLLAVVWLLLFSLWFYSLDLPNNRPLTRLDVLQQAPYHLLDVIDPPQSPERTTSRFTGLLQRLPMLFTAACLIAGAWGWGRGVIRGLALDGQLAFAERTWLSGLLGLTLLSNSLLLLGLAGALNPWILRGWLVAGILLGGACEAITLRQRAGDLAAPSDSRAHLSLWLRLLLGGLLTLMMITIVIGSLTPQNDFDVCEYHLGGPKEWFQQGQITFLPHNVYTSFPFLTEMLLLAGMVCYGDWQFGALAGQTVLASYALLTAVGLYAFARRWFSPTAGWLAATVWLTVPWTTRISIIAYAEGGLSAYLLATLLATGMALERLRQSPASVDRTTWTWIGLAGVFAGGAFGCKYPGLILAVIPAALVLAWGAGRATPLRLRLTIIATYSVGILLVAGPWLLKNLAETGNPVYPLAYNLFGGADWTPADHAKWQQGHPLPHYASTAAWLWDLGLKIQDFVGNNDWHSGLVFALAPLAWLAPRGRPFVQLASLYLLWLFAEWFFLTHHIDRFWVPMLPVAALLAGAGWSACGQGLRRFVVVPVVLVGLLLNLTIVTSGLVGYHAGLTDLTAALRTASPDLRFLQEERVAGRLVEDFHPLCIGKADLFHAEFPVTYNTVFDHSIFEAWCGVDDPAVSSLDRPLRSTAEILQTLQQHGITHLYIDWAEVARYRCPSSYGYTDFATPRRLAELVAAGVLAPPVALPETIALSRLGDDESGEVIRSWAPELIVESGDGPRYIARQLYPVRQPR